MRLIAIALALLEEREVSSILGSDLWNDLLEGVWLLILELVAGERQDLKAFGSKLLVDLN